MPQAQKTQSPRYGEYIRNRFGVYEFLANRYIEQVLYSLEPLSEQRKQQLIKDTEDAVYQIQDIFGSGENPTVVKWKGLLEIAKGNTEAGVRLLDTLYEQSVTTAGRPVGIDPIIPYALAKVYENTSEQGAVFEFLTSAISSGIASFTHPESLLEYCQTALNLELWQQAISNIDLYERHFGSNPKSRQIRIIGLIGANDSEQAAKLLDAEPENDPNTLKLRIALIQSKISQLRSSMGRTEMDNIEKGISGTEPNKTAADIQSQQDLLKKEINLLIDSFTQTVVKLSQLSADSINESYVSTVCDGLIADGKISQAKELVDTLLKNSPANVTALFYQNLLKEPQPEKADTSRRRQIEEQVYKNLPDSSERAFYLGLLYNRNNEPLKSCRTA